MCLSLLLTAGPLKVEALSTIPKLKTPLSASLRIKQFDQGLKIRQSRLLRNNLLVPRRRMLPERENGVTTGSGSPARPNDDSSCREVPRDSNHRQVDYER